MKNQEIKSENQVIFFNQIQKTLPKNIALVDEISDLLNISPDAAYRRIRGVKQTSFEETLKLCRHFNISIDSLTDVVTDKSYIRCLYSPLNFSSQDTKDYIGIINGLSDYIESFRLLPESEIILSAVDIPLFNLYPYKELTIFKLFSWHKSIYGYATDYETFIKESEITGLYNNFHEKIAKSYQLIPSTEIWTSETIDSVLRLLNYHFEMKHFSDEKNVLFLCEQLLNLINTLQDWVEKGKKGKKEVPFNFFISDADIGNTFVLFKSAESKNCLVRLYTINALRISDEGFCMETENWLRNLTQRSTLISKVSERERFKFFNAKKQKIKQLIEKIQSES